MGVQSRAPETLRLLLQLGDSQSQAQDQVFEFVYMSLFHHAFAVEARTCTDAG